MDRPQRPPSAAAAGSAGCEPKTGFGLRPPRRLRERWSDAGRELINPHATFAAAIDRILVTATNFCEEFARLDTLVSGIRRDDAVCRGLMTVPGVGAVVALSYLAALDDPTRSSKSKAVGRRSVHGHRRPWWIAPGRSISPDW